MKKVNTEKLVNEVVNSMFSDLKNMMEGTDVDLPVLSKDELTVVKENVTKVIEKVLKETNGKFAIAEADGFISETVRENNGQTEISLYDFSAGVVECLEDMLAEKDIYVPSDDREGEETEGCLYGDAYDTVTDAVRDILLDHLEGCENGFKMVDNEIELDK